MKGPEQLKAKFPGHQLKFAEFGSLEELKRATAAANENRRFGPEFTLMEAHGELTAITLDYGKKGAFTAGDAARLDTDEYRRLLAKYPGTAPVIILNSCKTGIEGGIAQALSHRLYAEVVGLNAALVGVRLSTSNYQDRLRLNLVLGDRNVGIRYIRGQKVAE